RLEDRFISSKRRTGWRRAKGLTFAESNEDWRDADGQDVRPPITHFIEAHLILDSQPQDGTEVYSAFVGRDLAEALLQGGNSPLKAWQRRYPGPIRKRGERPRGHSQPTHSEVKAFPLAENPIRSHRVGNSPRPLEAVVRERPTSRNRRRATPHQTISTTPNGQAPDRNP